MEEAGRGGHLYHSLLPWVISEILKTATALSEQRIQDSRVEVGEVITASTSPPGHIKLQSQQSEQVIIVNTFMKGHRVYFRLRRPCGWCWNYSSLPSRQRKAINDPKRDVSGCVSIKLYLHTQSASQFSQELWLVEPWLEGEDLEVTRCIKPYASVHIYDSGFSIL